VFGRRKNSDSQADDAFDGDATEVIDDDSLESDNDDGDADNDEVSALSPRPQGPWDISEVSDTDGYIDLGSVLIRPAPEMELRVEVEQTSGQVMGVTCVTEHGAVSIQAFAAPKSEGIWGDVRRDLRQQISSSGGLVDEVAGPWGTEIRTKVPAQQPDGTQGSQPARFVGVDGPRWFVRFVFLGPAATDAEAGALLEAIARDVVVARDTEARAPGDALPLRLPVATEVTDDQAGEAQGDPDDPAWQREDLSPFERGPEITEIR